MSEEKDIQAIIDLLDQKTQSGISRIHIDVEEQSREEAENASKMKEQYHHGRCDVGSPWATGTVRNFD